MYDVVFADCDIGDLKDVTDDLKEEKNTQADTLKQASGPYTVNPWGDEGCM